MYDGRDILAKEYMKEYFIDTKYGELFFVQTQAIVAHKASIGFVHGLGEHIRRYNHVMTFFSQMGFSCFGYDSYGHGKSSGKRGHIFSLSQWMEEIELLLEEIQKLYPKKPVILYGHSLGGNKLLRYLLYKKRLPDLAVVTSPFIEESIPSPSIKIAIGNMLNTIFPSLTLSNGLPKNALSNDSEVHKKYYSDPLVHNKISIRAGSIALESADIIKHSSSPLPIPTLLLHGGDDLCTSFSASERFASQVSNITWSPWFGAKHELHNETNKLDVLEYIVQWILEKNLV